MSDKLSGHSGNGVTVTINDPQFLDIKAQLEQLLARVWTEPDISMRMVQSQARELFRRAHEIANRCS